MLPPPGFPKWCGRETDGLCWRPAGLCLLFIIIFLLNILDQMARATVAKANDAVVGLAYKNSSFITITSKQAIFRSYRGLRTEVLTWMDILALWDGPISQNPNSSLVCQPDHFTELHDDSPEPRALVCQPNHLKKLHDDSPEPINLPEPRDVPRARRVQRRKNFKFMRLRVRKRCRGSCRKAKVRRLSSVNAIMPTRSIQKCRHQN
jgi:hypothetical protein